MRTALGLLLVVAVFATPADSPGSRDRTEVVRTGPLSASGYVKASLQVRTVPGGRCSDIGYTFVGRIAYRCGAKSRLFNACWRDGPASTDQVICMDTPWARTVYRLRSSYLLRYPGVTYGPAAEYPWGIELMTGNRCWVLQGAHDVVHRRGRTFVVDYACKDDHIVLLREGMRRGSLWYANAARWGGLKRGYAWVGSVPLRRVYFGTLPAPLARQNRLAGAAVSAARRIAHVMPKQARLDLVWVRLALPEANWAYIILDNVETDAASFVLLHRIGGRWRDARGSQPYCTTLPNPIRKQLFLESGVRDLPGADLAPAGEQRC